MKERLATIQRRRVQRRDDKGPAPTRPLESVPSLNRVDTGSKSQYLSGLKLPSFRSRYGHSYERAGVNRYRQAAGSVTLSMLRALASASFAGRKHRAGSAAQSLREATHGVVALEFAILSTAFMSLMLFVFEISYDQYCQEALDCGLNLAARQVSTGNAQNVQSVTQFTTTYLCPNLTGLLNCPTNVFVRIQNITFSGSGDFHNATTGLAPTSGSSLNLANYGTGNFCNAGPNHFYLLSAVFVGPSFVGMLLNCLFTLNYGGHVIHASSSNVAFATEYYAVTAATGSTPPLPQCTPTTVS